MNTITPQTPTQELTLHYKHLNEVMDLLAAAITKSVEYNIPTLLVIGMLNKFIYLCNVNIYSQEILLGEVEEEAVNYSKQGGFTQ